MIQSVFHNLTVRDEDRPDWNSPRFASVNASINESTKVI